MTDTGGDYDRRPLPKLAGTTKDTFESRLLAESGAPVVASTNEPVTREATA